jgi:hypothetical protein
MEHHIILFGGSCVKFRKDEKYRFSMSCPNGDQNIVSESYLHYRLFSGQLFKGATCK